VLFSLAKNVMSSTLVRSREIATTILDRIVFTLPGREAPLRTGPSDRRAIALSFDDGPSAENTPAVLDLLRRHDSRATFFVVGERARGQEPILAKATENGHELGNHTHRHRHTVTLSRAELRSEIARGQEIVASFDPDACLVRPPFGKDRRRIMQISADLGLITVAWSIDSGDARGYSTAKIVDTVMSLARPGAIVLFHDGGRARPGTLEACAHVVPALRDQGYALVTVRELLSYGETPVRLPRAAAAFSKARPPSS
jgi:peptidoglycan/xylan/chitin deacetylase (PgdA/CDA1 family)